MSGMSGTCEKLTEIASAGVAPALRAVDCLAGELTATTFGRLFGSHGAMMPVLTILLTLYIAFFAISLIFVWRSFYKMRIEGAEPAAAMAADARRAS